jgi:hypothetical protein
MENQQVALSVEPYGTFEIRAMCAGSFRGPGNAGRQAVSATNLLQHARIHDTDEDGG